MTEDQELVLEVAQTFPIIPIDKHRTLCIYCYAGAEYYDPPVPWPHRETCLWLRAVERVKKWETET